MEIKRAYRNKSLQMHPDKLNQRGQEVTEEDRANFQKMKGAYDVSRASGMVLCYVVIRRRGPAQNLHKIRTQSMGF